MTHVLEGRRQELIELCRKHHVRRLEVFGSATGSDFDEESSDIDLVVEFEDVPYAEAWLEDIVLTPDRYTHRMRPGGT